MADVDFYALPRSVQDNLLDSMSGQFTPAPILVRRGPRPSVLVSLVVAGAAAVGLAVLAGAGYGDAASPLSILPLWVAGVYALIGAIAAVALVTALVHHARAGDLPFAPGVFVFPASLVDARASTLHVFPLEGLTSVAARGKTVALAFGGRSFSFSAADADEAAQAVARVEAARDQQRAPVSDEERRRLDPLEPPSVVSPLASDVARTRTPRGWERLRWVAGPAAGAAVGVGVFFARQVGSDARCLAAAKAQDDVASYERYLARGRRHRDVVSQELLPRAALRSAVAQGSVEAIDALARAQPSSRIQPEIAAAREAAVVAELDRARKAGTFDAVLGFGEKYPERRKNAGFAQAKHELYARALERAKKELQPGVVDFAARLVASAERVEPRRTPAGWRGAVVEVRTRRVPSKELERADDLVRKSPVYNGVPSLASTHLEDARFAPHEKKLTEALAAALGAAFDAEIVTFEARPRLEDGDGKLPEPTTPTLFVGYRVEPSGTARALKRPRGIFLGLSFHFTTDFVVPGDASPLRTKVTLTQALPGGTLKDATGDTAPGVLEAQVYDEMSRDAFDALRGKFLGGWLKKAK